MLKNTLTSFMFLLGCCTILLGQDIQFTQFYNNVLYSNPAFAGSYHHARFILHERIQWPGLEAKYLTSMISFDTHFNKYNSGIGIYGIHDQQGNSIMNSSEIQGIYSYEVYTLNNALAIRMGGQIGYINRSLDYSKLLFPDQVDINGVNGVASSIDRNNQSINFMDISTGFIAYTNQVWIGYSIHHLNEPNQSFINDNSFLPQKHTFIIGYKYNLKSKLHQNLQQSITPSFHYKTQGKSDQSDMGLFYTINKYNLGIWYRGIPFFKNYNKNINNESLALLVGYKFGLINLSYSYDYIVSELNTALPYGAHELNVTFYPSLIPKSNKPVKTLPCPKF